ncbi:MAG TPA: IclR family transcriptional regulator [Gaiellaceae bacterium]|nr:IclR family transcriptional regulator [Gaiellaceae bacterium]
MQSLERGLDILLALAAGPATLTEIAGRTGLSKATAFRLLASLGHRHTVVKDSATNLYFLGPGAMVLGRGAGLAGGWISDLVRSALTRLWQETEETVTVHVSAGNDRICIEELPSPLPLRYTASIGASSPLVIGSAGRVLLAFMPEDVAERLIQSSPPVSYPDGTLVDHDELRRRVERTRRRGWATSSGERVPDASAVSVPVRGAHGTVAALSVLGPSARFPEGRFPALLAALRRAADEIEHAAGAPAAGERESATL